MATRRTNAATADPLTGVTPGKPIDFARFQKILKSYNEKPGEQSENLSGVSIYVYRKFPRVDNTTAARPVKYIERIDGVAEGGAVTPLPEDLEEFIRVRHGGGLYNLSLNDKKAENKQICGSNLKIDEVEYPPIVDVKELVVTDDATATWAMRQCALGKFVKNADGSYSLKEAAQAAAASGAAEATIARIAERSTQGNPMMDAMKASTDMMHTTFTGLLKAATEGKQDNGMGQVMTLLVTMLTNAQQTNTALMSEILKSARQQAAPAPVQAAPVGSLKEKLEELSMLRDLFDKGSDGGGWMDVLKTVAPMAAPMLLQMMNKPATPATPGAAIAPAAPEPAQQQQQQQSQIAAVFCQKAAACVQGGADGSDLAQAIDLMIGAEQYNALRNYGKDNLTAMLLQSPQAAVFSANGEATQVFLQEFIDYGAPQQEGATE